MKKINLTDIEKFAVVHLKIDKIIEEERYILKKVDSEIICQYFPNIFDFRINQEPFKSAHLSFIFIEKEGQVIAGNSSIFLLEKTQFNYLRFWKRENWVNKSIFNKITLNDFPTIEGIDQIVMHGYIQSPLFMQNSNASHTYSWIVYRYVKFLMSLAKLCKKEKIPILIETTGRLALKNAPSRLQLDETALAPEECASIGMTRPKSLVSEKIARMLCIQKINNVFNERTLGKVFFSIPG